MENWGIRFKVKSWQVKMKDGVVYSNYFFGILYYFQSIFRRIRLREKCGCGATAIVLEYPDSKKNAQLAANY